MSEKDDAFSVVLDEPSTKNEVSGPKLVAPVLPSEDRTGAMMVQSQVMMPSSSSSSSSLGKLGRYNLVSKLGKGGMAEVFLATQDGPAGFQKQVVIKRSDPELAKNPRFVDMFLREAKIAALLNHNNVVQVFELGQEGETYFIAMEHIDGISLHRAARQAWAMGESIPMEVVVKCIADAARGLHYAHHWKD
ncbi:MAG: protein kinase, partial [Deltaproteobacteria bacterium]|nr:protein kinase [Deltaproteobacteria bacterium]